MMMEYCASPSTLIFMNVNMLYGVREFKDLPEGPFVADFGPPAHT